MNIAWAKARSHRQGRRLGMSYKAFQKLSQHILIDGIRKMKPEAIHSMLVKQNERIAELEQQRDDLLNVMKKAQDLIELCEDPWEAARLLDKTIAKAGVK